MPRRPNYRFDRHVRDLEKKEKKAAKAEAKRRKAAGLDPEAADGADEAPTDAPTDSPDPNAAPPRD